MIGVIFNQRATVKGRTYRPNEFASFVDDFAEALCRAGTCRRADGAEVDGRMVDGHGHEIRAFEVGPRPTRRPIGYGR
jgi:hypothetical protein